jgi:hypothetical protein
MTGIRMPAVQYWFTGSALYASITLLAAILTLGAAWYRAARTEMESANSKVASTAQQQKTVAVKELRGKALVSGDRLIRDIRGENIEVDQAEKEANAWGQRAHDLIAAAYGDGEAARFLDSSGYVFYGDGTPKSNIRNWIDGRMRRLTELFPRADSLAVREDFDPSKFSLPESAK